MDHKRRIVMLVTVVVVLIIRIMSQEEERRKKKLGSRVDEVLDWMVVGRVGEELEEAVQAHSALSNRDRAIQAIREWLVCVAASREAARRRFEEWYVLTRQQLWFAGFVMKEWDDKRWKRFFRVDNRTFWKLE